jgi:protoporphyrinogen oxidase
VPTALVIGGGISGLAAAHRLARSGVAVTLLESSPRLGGLGTFAEVGGRTVERFYHCVMPTDEHLLPLMEELGLAGDIGWSPTTMGMITGGRRYAFNTARDLLAYRPLSLVQRVRFGVVSLLLRRLGAGRDLDNTRTEDWLRGLYGNAVWERMFKPLFGMKFGAAFGDVPARYLWERLGRDSNVATRGYPDGGYGTIIAALRAAIEAEGGVVRTDAPVVALSADTTGVRVELASGERLSASWGVATAPLPALRAVADPALAAALPVSNLDYQGVVNVLTVLRRPLDGHYWSPVIDSGTGFDGVVDMSQLNGNPLVYTMKYCSRTSELFARPDDEIAQEWTAQLLALYPDRLSAEDVAEVRVFRAPFVEPVYPLGYGTSKPGADVPGTRLVLATTAQVYPDVTSWNSSTGLAHRVADGLLTRIAAEPPVITLA